MYRRRHVFPVRCKLKLYTLLRINLVLEGLKEFALDLVLV
jgi:hypothetical protein